MKTNLSKHFKDRSPNDTVNIIRNFFENNGYTIKEHNFIQSEADTWGCVIQLFYQDVLLYTQCGKGLTSEYTRASGYAELYERFCNKPKVLWSPILLHKLYQCNYKQHQYYYAVDEKEVSYYELLNEPLIKKYYTSLFNNQDQLKNYLNCYLDNKYLQVPFKSLTNTDDIYLNPMLLLSLTGTNGMAAGNSYCEAVNQGLSELYERYCLNQFLTNSDNQIYYELNKDNIENQELKQKIQLIEKNGNIIHLIDLSYTYHYPVLLAILINSKTKNITVNAGAFPIFDIALERIITEIYQNFYSYNNFKSELQIPFKDIDNIYQQQQAIHSATQNILNEHIFSQFKLVNTYNLTEYMSLQDYSNQDILNWCIQKNQEHNNDVYVRDVSLCSDFYAIHIYCKNLSIITREPFKLDTDIHNYTNYFDHALEMYKLLVNHTKLYIDNKLALKTLLKDYKLLNNNHYYNTLDNLLNGTLLISPFSMLDFDEREMVYTFINTFYNKSFYYSDLNDNDIYRLLFTWKDYQENISKYLLFRRYLDNDNYNQREIQEFFKQINQTITDDDFELFENSAYVLFKMIFEQFRNIYGEHIEDILKGYIQ